MVSPILPTKKDNLVLNKPPLIKSCTDIKQFVKQPFHLHYSNHAQSVESAVKLTATASGRIAAAKMQIGKELCITAGRKKQWIGKEYYATKKLLMPVKKIKVLIAICIALTVFFLLYIIPCKQ